MEFFIECVLSLWVVCKSVTMIIQTKVNVFYTKLNKKKLIIRFCLMAYLVRVLLHSFHRRIFMHFIKYSLHI